MQITSEEEMIKVEDDAAASGNLLDSKTSLLNDILQEKLEQAFHKQTSTVVLHDIVKIASEHSPVDLAYAASRLPPHARPMIYENLSGTEAKIDFMINTDSSTRVAVFRHISDVEVKKLMEQMPPDEAVEVLEDISERRFRRVVEMLEVSKAFKIREIQKHRRNTAGRLMTNEFFAFSMDVTIAQAAAHIRHQSWHRSDPSDLCGEPGRGAARLCSGPQSDRQSSASAAETGDEIDPI